MKRFRIQLVIAFIVLVCGVSLMGLVYILFGQPDKIVNPGIVVSSSSPVAAPAVPARSRSFTFPPRMNNHTLTGNKSTVSTYRAPEMQTTSPNTLFSTSSAQVHSVGGGSNAAFANTASSQSASSRGIAYGGAVTMPMTTFIAMASSRQVAAPAANEAPAMAQLARHAPPPPQPPGPGGLDPEHQLIEQPVGDALIPLLIFLLGYIVYRKNRLAV